MKNLSSMWWIKRLIIIPLSHNVTFPLSVSPKSWHPGTRLWRQLWRQRWHSVADSKPGGCGGEEQGRRCAPLPRWPRVRATCSSKHTTIPSMARIRKYFTRVSVLPCSGCVSQGHACCHYFEIIRHISVFNFSPFPELKQKTKPNVMFLYQ